MLSAGTRLGPWSHDGRRLFFRQTSDGSAALMAVEVSPQPRLTVSSPQRITALPAAGLFDVLPDGSFVMVDTRRAPGATDQLNVVLN